MFAAVISSHLSFSAAGIVFDVVDGCVGVVDVVSEIDDDVMKLDGVVDGLVQLVAAV